MDPLSLADLADLGRGLRPADLGATLLLVDLDAGPAPGPAALRAAAEAAATLAAPVVGVTTDPEAADPALLAALSCTLAPGSGTRPEIVYGADVAGGDLPDPGLLSAAASRCPQAAAVLDGVLRQTVLLPVWDGLVAESAAYSLLLAGPEFAGWLASARRPPPAPSDDEPVLVTLRSDGTVLDLELHRPQRRNAFGHAVRDALVDALALAHADPDLQVFLHGAGAAFCSGGDLAEFGTAPDPVTAYEIRLARSVGWSLHRLAPRATVRVHGGCVGAGIELPAFAGRVSAAPDARFLLPEIGMGLIPGAGGTVSIPRRIGRWRTAWWALSGQWLAAPTALAWGLVDEVAAR